MPSDPHNADPSQLTAEWTDLGIKPSRLKTFLLAQGGLITSVVVHALIVVLGLIVSREVVRAVESVSQEQVIIPDANLVDAADMGGVPNPGLGEDPTRRSLQNIDPTVTQSNDWANRRTASLSESLADSAAQASSAITPIGQGVRSSGTVTGLSDRNTAGGGRMGMFGPPGGGGGLSQGIFNPQGKGGGNARKIVYVCDASGSIGTSADRKFVLIAELNRAIDALKPQQFFNVIFFSDGQPIVLDRATLIQANADNKRKAREFLDAVPMSGSTNPLPALEIAFRQQPELIFLLTDGEFGGEASPQDVIDTIDRLNRDRKTAVNTIMLDNTSAAEHKTLQTIADQNGGRFLSVTARELMQRR